MLEAIHISKAFDGKTVLNDVNMRVEGTVAVMAPSGTGKTTLLRILLGLEKPDAGTIRVTGTRMAAVFQEDRLIEHMTALQNLSLAAPDRKRPALLEHLEALGLSSEANQPVKIFSGGMKRRVAIARAIACEPDMLLLDEPFSGLDDAMKVRAAEYIRTHMQGKDVILVTHDREEARLLEAREIIVLE